eukprot:scaffold78403_cov30-Tisochrysis_lutea.AAC.3
MAPSPLHAPAYAQYPSARPTIVPAAPRAIARSPRRAPRPTARSLPRRQRPHEPTGVARLPLQPRMVKVALLRHSEITGVEEPVVVSGVCALAARQQKEGASVSGRIFKVGRHDGGARDGNGAAHAWRLRHQRIRVYNRNRCRDRHTDGTLCRSTHRGLRDGHLLRHGICREDRDTAEGSRERMLVGNRECCST